MNTSPISIYSYDDDIDIPAWVNRPYEQRRAQIREQERLEELRRQRAQREAEQRAQRRNDLERQPSKDIYKLCSSKGKRAEGVAISPHLAGIGALVTAAALVLAIYTGATGSSRASSDNEPTDLPPSASDTYVPPKTDDPFAGAEEPEVNTQGPIQHPIEEEPVEVVGAEPDPTPSHHPMIDEEFVGSGAPFLEELNSLTGVAIDNYYKLCNAFGMTEEETADYLTQMCESEKWANGVTYPSLLLAQISRESKYNPYAVGDGGLAIGLGQFHTCAVDEVNKQFKTHYTYDDRYDPFKAIEMMALLLNYDRSRTESIYDMLSMYNQGHPAIHEAKGVEYVRNVLSEIDQVMS